MERYIYFIRPDRYLLISLQDRLPFLDTGIVDILTNATQGLGVVLEHRYYGKLCGHTSISPSSLRWLGESIAVQNLTTDSLRYVL